MREFAAVTRKIASSCASTAMIYLMHVCGAQVIAASGSPEKERLMRKIVSGNALATLAFSERGSRSHFWAPVSRAAQNDGSTILNCDKSFVTSAGYADYYVVSSGAVTAKGPLDSPFTVEREAAGIEVSGRWNGLGLRGKPALHAATRLSRQGRLPPQRRRGRFEDDAGCRPPLVSGRKRGGVAWDLRIRLRRRRQAQSTARLEHLGESLASPCPEFGPGSLA